MMLWKKPSGVKYTDMCIYIDENIPNLTNPGEFPDVENRVYNYLWLLVKALAIKKCMFNNFQDYDPYAFYAANRLFFALRKNQLNQGKVIKGRLIRPIKSSLNYTKALLYPMKLEYQKESFNEILTEEFISKKFDAFSFTEQMRVDARASQGVYTRFWDYLKDSFTNCNSFIDDILSKSLFNKNSVEYKRLKMSLMLNCINSLKTKGKLEMEPVTIILWKLPKSMASYVRILLKEFYTEIKKEIMECYDSVNINDELLDKLLSRKEEFGDKNEDQY